MLFRLYYLLYTTERLIFYVYLEERLSSPERVPIPSLTLSVCSY